VLFGQVWLHDTAGHAVGSAAPQLCGGKNGHDTLALKTDGKIPVPFSTFVRSFPYLRGPVSVFTEMREGFFRPFPWDPVFT
jgi:hypothetical protein